MGIFHEINDMIDRWTGNDREYNAQQGRDEYGIYVGTEGVKPIYNPGSGNTSNYKPTAYSRTAAATAKDIAQGGMTKDEVIEFNMKHPNETAQRSE